MKQFLLTFAAVLSAIIVGLFGYEWYKDAAVKRGQDYRTAAYLGQIMAITSTMKSATDSAWQMTGELPCSADDYAAAGLRLPGHTVNSSVPRIDVTDCGEFTFTFSAFDGTQPGKIVMKATPDPDAYGTYFSWSCVSPSYESIEEYFSWCRFVAGDAAPTPEASAN